jgi:hypothetical protein
MLVVNLDKKQFLDPAAFGETSDLKALINSYQGVMTGLTVLCADGNNRGGGDLRSEDDVIGAWAGDRIAAVDDDGAVRLAGTAVAGVLASWTDVSKDVIRAINDGVGNSWVTGQLNPALSVPVSLQRRVAEVGLQRPLFDPVQRLMPLQDVKELFGLFGQFPAFSEKTAAKRLQEGVDSLAALLGEQAAVKVDWLKIVGTTDQVLDTAELGLADASGKSVAARVFVFKFAQQEGPSAAQLLEIFFPSVFAAQTTSQGE